jgi:hyperosmotically inducible protein
MKISRKKLTLTLLSLMLVGYLATGMLAAQQLSEMEENIRLNLVMLPYYGVFDYLEFKLDGTDVTLMGQVNRPILKSSAETTVKRVPGVGIVKNEIEVLPVSPNDDRIRLDIYRAIYYHPDFLKYATRAVPPIHILVKNGDVTLVGSVSNEMDKKLADFRANGVAGVFSVTNKLEVIP